MNSAGRSLLAAIAIVQNHSHHRHEVGGVVLVAAEGRAKFLGDLGG